jgi:hypothetical protein
MAVGAGVSMFDHFGKMSRMLRTIGLLPDPDFFTNLSPAQKEPLNTANELADDDEQNDESGI